MSIIKVRWHSRGRFLIWLIVILIWLIVIESILILDEVGPVKELLCPALIVIQLLNSLPIVVIVFPTVLSFLWAYVSPFRIGPAHSNDDNNS